MRHRACLLPSAMDLIHYWALRQGSIWQVSSNELSPGLRETGNNASYKLQKIETTVCSFFPYLNFYTWWHVEISDRPRWKCFERNSVIYDFQESWPKMDWQYTSTHVLHILCIAIFFFRYLYFRLNYLPVMIVKRRADRCIRFRFLSMSNFVIYSRNIRNHTNSQG